MKIAVCVKAVPDAAGGRRLDPQTFRLERGGELAISDYDTHAVEEALKLRDAAAQPDQPEVHIRRNKLVEYRAVATVLASAQRLGVTKLGMIGNEQFVK